VYLGKAGNPSKAFKKKAAKNALEEHCLSIVHGAGSLDLEAPSGEVRMCVCVRVCVCVCVKKSLVSLSCNRNICEYTHAPTHTCTHVNTQIHTHTHTHAHAHKHRCVGIGPMLFSR
jgi:hypothetical protein